MPLYRIVGVILKPVESAGPWGWLIGIGVVLMLPFVVLYLVILLIFGGIDAIFGTRLLDKELRANRGKETTVTIGQPSNTSGNNERARFPPGEVGSKLFLSNGGWRAINMTKGLRGAGQDAGFYYGYFEYLNFTESDRGRILTIEVKSQYIPTRIELWQGNIAGDDHAWWTHYGQAASSSAGTVFEQKPNLRWVIAPGNYTLYFAAFSQSGNVSNMPFFAKLDIGPPQLQGQESAPEETRENFSRPDETGDSRPRLAEALSAPLLIEPIDGATLSQPDAGDWIFDWADVPTAVKYEIIVQGLTAKFPVLHTETTVSRYTIPRKDGYIADQNLRGWSWRVRAKTQNAQWGEWSALRRFNVSPRNQ
jgi:hypothetical protein